MDNFSKKVYNKKNNSMKKKGAEVLKMSATADKPINATNIDPSRFEKLSWSEIQKLLTKKSALGKSVMDIYRERK